MTHRSSRSLVPAILWLALLSGCPPTPPVLDGPDLGGPDLAEDGDCGRAQDALDDGDYTRAVTLLREQSVIEPEFGSRPRTDLCLSRALLGEGSPGEALVLASGVADDAAMSEPLRRQACVLAIWADLREGDRIGARSRLGRCDRGAPLGAGDAFLEDDADDTLAVLATAHAESGDLVAALRSAEGLLAAAEPTREWAVRSALAWAHALDLDDVERLAAATRPGDRLAPAASAVAELEAARAAADDSAVERLRGVVEERLTALDSEAARSYLGALGGVGEDQPRAAIFGAVLPSRGPSRAEARATLAGLLLAQRAFQPGYEPFSQLLVRETAEDEAEVRSAVAELEAAGVLALIAPTIPEVARWVVRDAEQLGVPVLSLGSPPPPGARWSFGFEADPRAEAAALLEFCAVRGVRTIAVAMPERPAPHLAAVAEALAELGREQRLAVDEPVRYYTDDLQSELADLAERLARRDFDALLIADSGANASTLAAYLAVENVWSGDPTSAGGERRLVQYLGTSAWEDTSFLDTGPDYLSGGVFPAWHTGAEEAARFADEFAYVYGRAPGLPDALAFDALTLLRALVLDYGASTRAGLRDALTQGTGLVGATGPLAFGADRRRGLQPQLMRVTSGSADAAP